MSAAEPTVARRRRQALITAICLVVVAVVVVITWVIDGNDTDQVSGQQNPAHQSSTQARSTATMSRSASAAATPGTPRSTRAASTRATTAASAPVHVLRTLALIDAGQWPEAADAPGTKGGVVFRNSEGRLPRSTAAGVRITYQEWDVNPKQDGRSRDAERIVTGSDGSAWYTSDHYQTFNRIRGPNS
ncbi:ribonuclease domain-containing protein [Gordonia sp. NPDC003376]